MISEGEWCVYFNEKSLLHRLNGPAVEYADGGKEWRLNGKRHRLDGPAVEYADGSKEWWVNGKLHRLGGPAVEHLDGRKEWWADGKRHRLDGPAVEYKSGRKEWWVDGEQHRLNGPAVEGADGHKEWWVGGERHRLDGPAVDYRSGYKEWWVNGIMARNQELCRKITKTKVPVSELFSLCTHEDFVVRTLALHNYNVPESFRIAAKLISQKQNFLNNIIAHSDMPTTKPSEWV